MPTCSIRYQIIFYHVLCREFSCFHATAKNFRKIFCMSQTRSTTLQRYFLITINLLILIQIMFRAHYRPILQSLSLEIIFQKTSVLCKAKKQMALVLISSLFRLTWNSQTVSMHSRKFTAILSNGEDSWILPSFEMPTFRNLLI